MLTRLRQGRNRNRRDRVISERCVQAPGCPILAPRPHDSVMAGMKSSAGLPAGCRAGVYARTRSGAKTKSQGLNSRS
jgi:hypothetical protein